MNIFKQIFKTKNKTIRSELYYQKKHISFFDQYDHFEQIVSIFDYTLNPNLKIANKAAETIDRLFKLIKVINNKKLYNTFKYLSISSKELKKFDRFEKDTKVTLLCITTMNGNGYTREEALKKLITINTSKAIPFILLRLTDWVPAIQKKAEAAIPNLLTKENTIYLIQNHKLINWLLNIKRVDLSEVHNEIRKFITTEQLNSDQIAKLKEGDRFFYYKSYLENKTINDSLIQQILKDKYYLIRILLIRYIDDIDNHKQILLELLSDKSEKIRQTAIYLIAKQNIYEYETILSTLIFDSSKIVRIEARHLLSKIKKYNFKKIYLDHLSNNKLRASIILGLSEVINKNETFFIERYLNSDYAIIRSAALRGIYNLNSQMGTENAYQTLENDLSITNRKIAGNILFKEGVDFTRLRKLYDLTDSTGKKIILRLFNKYSNWSVAGDFLKALIDEDKNIQTMAKVFLESWNKYTIGLATKIQQEDKDYVLSWYKKTTKIGIKVSANIPFIFREI